MGRSGGNLRRNSPLARQRPSFYHSPVSTPHAYSLDTLGLLDESLPLYAILGDPIAHSLSPEMQNAAFQALGIPARYVRIHVPGGSLADAVAILKKKNFRGWNCTLPHKQDMLLQLDRLAPAMSGAVSINTVKVENGELVGYNTDGTGWLNALREELGIDAARRPAMGVLILGLGGAGTTLAHQAAEAGFGKIVLANRTHQKAEAVAAVLKNRRPGLDISAVSFEPAALQDALKKAALLVNCITVGALSETKGLFPEGSAYPDLLVYDTNYQPRETPLLQAARRAGARAVNGLSMLLHQGAEAFTIWTGQPAPLDAMREALQKALPEKSS
jgi:shikimate dehydrogenase